jgi:hypothetical protein
MLGDNRRAVAVYDAAPAHWRCYGTEPLPSGPDALDEPFSAFPSGFYASSATGAANADEVPVDGLCENRPAAASRILV